MELQQRLEPTVRMDLRPLLIQAVRLLPLSQIELRQYLLQEYLQNPALELQPTEGATSLEDLAARDMDTVHHEQGGDDDAWLSQLLEETAVEVPIPEEREPAADRDWIWHRQISSPKTLIEHLRWQIAHAPVDDETVREIMYFLAEFVNSSGYLEESDAELAQLAGVPEDLVHSARQALMRLDPPGIGARSLQECLLVQLEVLGQQDSWAYRIIRDAWDDLVARRWLQIRERFGLRRDEWNAVLETIHHLDPRPAQHYIVHQVLYVYPDVIVREEDGEYVVELTRQVVPRIRISRRYLRMLRNPSALTPEERAYIRERILAARQLLRSLRYCEHTLLRVAKFIVRYQREFFERGLSALKPMSLRDVAMELGLHESTISRTVQHKYMQTPRGTFEMRFFFQRRIPTQSGTTAVSPAWVKQKIRQLIDMEDPRRPYTDDELARLIRLEGVRISRRAITKYRQEMHIPSSRERRRAFLMTGEDDHAD